MYLCAFFHEFQPNKWMSGDKCLLSGDKRVISGDKVLTSGDKHTMSGDKSDLSGDNAREWGSYMSNSSGRGDFFDF